MPGYLVDAHDPTALAVQVEKVLGDPVLADELRHKGLKRAKAFTWEASAQKLMAVINNVGAGDGNRPLSLPGERPGPRLDRHYAVDASSIQADALAENASGENRLA